MVEDIRRLREKIYETITELKEISAKKFADPVNKKGGPEITLSFRALQQARHWLGEALGEMGKELPEEFANKGEKKAAKTGKKELTDEEKAELPKELKEDVKE